jgi:DNA-binding transcriptional LysR family regulator
LSRSIAGLEAAVGERLFNRTRHGAEPTAFGELLLSRAGAILEGAAFLEQEIERMRGLEVGKVRVGSGPYPAELSVGQAVGELARRYPKLRVEVTVTDLPPIVDALVEGKFDVGVLELSYAESETRLTSEPLPRHPALLFVRAGHPLESDRNLPLARIAEFPFTGPRIPPRLAKRFVDVFSSGGIDRDTGDYLPSIRVDSFATARAVVLASDAVGVSPLPLIRTDLEEGRLAALPVELPALATNYGLVYRRDRKPSPAAEAFMAEVRKVEAKIAAEEAHASAMIAARQKTSPRSKSLPTKQSAKGVSRRPAA